MAVPILQASFIAGEVAPALYGRFDLARNHSALSTARNGYIGYQGGFYSRAGTAFVGFSKQTGRNYPPRMIPFDFSINQGLALEFGNYYMRVISDGAFVTEAGIALTGVSNASPCVISFAASTGASGATPNNSAVTYSYAPGEQITLAGGTFMSPAVLSVASTQVNALALNAPGGASLSYGGYAPGDTITLAGGTQTTAPVLTVNHTQLTAAAIANGGNADGQPGSYIFTGTTGTGTKFQIYGHVDNTGNVVSLGGILSGGDYSVNPTFTNAPVTGTTGAPTGVILYVRMGVLDFTISTAGVLTANPSGAAFTQASTSGNGINATFENAIFAPHALTVAEPGSYTAFPSNPVAQASTTGSGFGATFTCSTTNVSPFADGDWAYVAGIDGPGELNGNTFVLAGVTTTSAELYDVYGNAIDSSTYPSYVSGGTAAKLVTVATPYAEADLPWLKFIQSADVMSLCCVNQQTQTEYPPQDMARFSDTDWRFSPVVPVPSVLPPQSLTGLASSGGSVNYEYVATAVGADGSESIASPIAEVNAAVDIASTAGTITLTWGAVTGVHEYYIYKAYPGYNTAVPSGALFGFAGQAYGTQFIDSNIVPDVTQVPPQHKNPFAPGQIIDVPIEFGGSLYTSITFSITTSTGTGAVLVPVIVGGALVAVLIEDSGQDFEDGDTIAVSGDGSGAQATLTIGPPSGTYPGVVNYFQERRAYANSLNNPDTYWMSQPGLFTNFDARTPTIDSDAITGSPWSLEVNGIQFMVPTAGGLLVFTGLANWLLVGVGSFATNVQPITPASQVATPQPENGCSATVPPIKINYDVIYVSSKGSFYFDQPYQLYALSEPVDITESSSHLFVGYTILEHTWCQQPYKVVWSVRNDGAALSLTWLKQQQVAAWARHDTQGQFVSVCSITEPPVDAPYFATQRYPGGKTAYMIERMDNRIWSAAEDCWCVDCGLSLPQPTPNATLNVSSPTGLGALTGVTGLVGGTSYSAATYATVADDNGDGPGSGAVPTLTIVAGVITAVTFAGGSQGTKYINPALTFIDPENSGSGAAASPVLDNSATFTASAAAFALGDVGSIIRSGGGIARITAYTDNEHVAANILSPIVELIPDTGVAAPQPAGSWTMTKPATVISGLNHLIGATVTGLADGNVIPPTVVAADGTITLGTAASAVIVGLGFTAQAQSLYLDAGQPTIQGQRKKVAEVVVRLQASRGVQVGTNQPDGATQSPVMLAPPWNDLATVPDDGPNFPAKPYNALCTPLRTGDSQKIPVFSGFSSPGQVAMQQVNPLPMEILAIIPDAYSGDIPQSQVPKPQQNGR